MRLLTGILVSLFALAASAKQEHYSQSKTSYVPGCDLFDVKGFFTDGNSPTRIEVRYSCDKEPIGFVKTMHKKEEHLFLWRGQGDSEDENIDIRIETIKGRSKISGALRIGNLKLKLYTSWDESVKVFDYGPDAVNPSNLDSRKKRKDNSFTKGVKSEKSKEFSWKNSVKSKDNPSKKGVKSNKMEKKLNLEEDKPKKNEDWVFREDILELNVKHLRSELERSHDEIRKLRKELFKCEKSTLKKKKQGRSTKAPNSVFPQKKKRNYLREDYREKKDESQKKFVHQLMVFLFSRTKDAHE